jgi:dTDP-4-amino-4,6-dideoxygalactose transaminase
VVRAGLEPVLCDVKPSHFQMDLDDLSSRINSNTLAIMAVHLFGIPENMSGLNELAKQKGVFVVEDAAQAFGNTYGSTSSDYLGRFGDLSILSFGRGKPMSLLSGGTVIVNNSELDAPVTKVYQSLPKPKKWRFLSGYLFLLFLYAIFYHPRAHWLPRSLPWLRLGDTYFILDYDITKIGPRVLNFGNTVFKTFEEIRKIRLNLATRYRERLEGIQEAFAYFPNFKGDNIALLRFPIIFKEKEVRDRILKYLEEKGLGATGSFPVPLNELEGACDYLDKNETYSNAKEISERILTLPLHEYVTLEDIDHISQIIADNL